MANLNLITESEATILLKEHFNLANFRKGQFEKIKKVANAKQIFVVEATGSGKRLLYQFPGVIEPGLTLVIQPTVSLIYDQVEKLKSLKIKVDCLNPEYSKDKKKKIAQNLMRAAFTGSDLPYKFIYACPENLNQSDIIDALKILDERNLVNRIVIDEAHCIYSWGNFREEYTQLASLRANLKNAKLSLFSATAPPAMRLAIRNNLELKDCTLYEELIGSIDRPNIRYFLEPRDKNIINFGKAILQLIRKNFRGKAGIIYCLTEQHVQNLYAELKKELGNKVCMYFSQMLTSAKKIVQQKWKDNEIDIIVATSAFGMGIDKPNIRLIIHMSMAYTIEDYIQQCGRAGRDGKDAYCFSFFKLEDADIIEDIKVRKVKYSPANIENEKKNLNDYYLNDKICRRQSLLNIIDDPKAKNLDNGANDNEIDQRCCDYCYEKKNFEPIVNYQAGDSFYAKKSINQMITKVVERKSFFHVLGERSVPSLFGDDVSLQAQQAISEPNRGEETQQSISESNRVEETQPMITDFANKCFSPVVCSTPNFVNIQTPSTSSNTETVPLDLSFKTPSSSSVYYSRILSSNISDSEQAIDQTTPFSLRSNNEPLDLSINKDRSSKRAIPIPILANKEITKAATNLTYGGRAKSFKIEIRRVKIEKYIKDFRNKRAKEIERIRFKLNDD